MASTETKAAVNQDEQPMEEKEHRQTAQDPSVENDETEQDEEEDFLCAIEKQKEDEENTKKKQQPNATSAAPKLLQDALKQGQVKPDDSEGETDATKDALEKKNSGETKEEEKKEETSQYHARVSY